MPFVHGKSPQLMKKQSPNFCRIKMFIFIFGWRYGNMFQYRRKVKCMLDTVIVTPYHYDSIKFIPVSAENIYDLPSSSMHRNIAISNFQLNFARQILSPHISDPSKKISPSTKQIIDLRVLKSAYGFYFITKLIYGCINVVDLKFLLQCFAEVLLQKFAPIKVIKIQQMRITIIASKELLTWFYLLL